MNNNNNNNKLEYKNNLLNKFQKEIIITSSEIQYFQEILQKLEKETRSKNKKIINLFTALTFILSLLTTIAIPIILYIYSAALIDKSSILSISLEELDYFLFYSVFIVPIIYISITIFYIIFSKVDNSKNIDNSIPNTKNDQISEDELIEIKKHLSSNDFKSETIAFTNIQENALENFEKFKKIKKNILNIEEEIKIRNKKMWITLAFFTPAIMLIFLIVQFSVRNKSNNFSVLLLISIFSIRYIFSMLWIFYIKFINKHKETKENDLYKSFYNFDEYEYITTRFQKNKEIEEKIQQIKENKRFYEKETVKMLFFWTFILLFIILCIWLLPRVECFTENQDKCEINGTIVENLSKWRTYYDVRILLWNFGAAFFIIITSLIFIFKDPICLSINKRFQKYKNKLKNFKKLWNFK